jgi:hypothetical protein
MGPLFWTYSVAILSSQNSLYCMMVSGQLVGCLPMAEMWFVHESRYEKRFIAHKQTANVILVQNSQNSRKKIVWLIKSRSCNYGLKYLELLGVEVEVFVWEFFINLCLRRITQQNFAAQSDATSLLEQLCQAQCLLVYVRCFLFLEDINPSFDGISSQTSAVYLEMPTK